MRAGLIAMGVTSLAVLTACGAVVDDAVDVPTETTAREVSEGPVAATAVVAGDCLTDVVIGAAERAEVESARKVSCHSEHTLEIYATFTLSPADFDQEGTEYPGTPRVVRIADRGCEQRFSGLTDDPDRYGLIVLWPTRTSWSTGDRTVACAAFSASGELFTAPQFA